MKEPIHFDMLEGAGAEIYLTLTNGDNPVNVESYNVYGAAEQGNKSLPFTVTPTGGIGQYRITIPPLSILTRTRWNMQICVRRESTAHEWHALEGTIQLHARRADMEADKLAQPEYHADFSLLTGELTFNESYTPPAKDTDKGEFLQKNYIKWSADYTEASGNLEDLKDGSAMFQSNATLESFSADLSALTIGVNMFNACAALSSFTGNLSALTNGKNMFSNSPNLTSWNIDLPALTNGQYMFATCKGLSSFTGNLSALTNGSYMFNGDSALAIFTSDLPSLTSAYYMFARTVLTSWDIDLPALTNGSYMFFYCQELSSFTGNLSALKTGSYMFQYCPNLTSWNIDLPALTIGQYMFSHCTGLTSWNIDLPALTNGSYMFQYCEGLTSWNIDLPALTNGSYMFQRIPALESFTGNLSALTNGDNMFTYSSGLTSFTSDLSALTTGKNMFNKCKLDKESALRVLNSLQTFTSGSRTLAIGIHIDHKTDEEVQAAITAATAKKWTISAQYNGTATAATYSLRRPTAPPVYARLDETGEETILDWAHEIHSPDNETPEEMGYTLFDSLEAAKEHFNITEE